MAAEGDLGFLTVEKAAFLFAIAIVTISCSTGTGPAAVPAKETPSVGSIVRLNPAFDALVPKDAHIEKLAGDFQFTEGPVWRSQGPHL